jgi:hypothetical protein
MEEGISSIITLLERQSAAIEQALTALRAVEGAPVDSAPASSSSTRRKTTPPVLNRRSEGQRRRWAAKKAAGAESTPNAAREPRITAEGRQRLAEAMKRRWAVKRAAAAKKPLRKQAVAAANAA